MAKGAGFSCVVLNDYRPAGAIRHIVSCALGVLLILALAGAHGAAAQATGPDEEIVRLIFANFNDPPLSDAQRAAVESFVRDADPDHKLLLPDFLTQHQDPEAKRRFQAAAPDHSRAYTAFYERAVTGLNAALGDRGYAMPLAPSTERARLPRELATPHARLMARARDTKDPRERVQLYTDALFSVGELDLRLSSPLAHFERAMAHFELHDVHSAFDDLSADLSLYPGHPEGLYNRALAAAFLERWDVALRDASDLIELYPAFPLAYVARGQAWAELGDHAAALRDLNRAVALDPEDLWARLARGSEHGLRRRADEATADCMAAVRLSTASALGHGCLGFAYLESSRFAEAAEAFAEAIQLDAANAGAYAGLAVSRLRTGDLPGADSAYERAVVLEPLFGVSAAGLASGGVRWVKVPGGGESFEVHRFSPRVSAAVDELIRLRGGGREHSPPGGTSPAPTSPAWAGPPIKARLSVDSPGERLTSMDGRLIPNQADLVLKSKAYAEAKELRRRPAYRELPPEVRRGLEADWDKIEAEKVRLLEEARGLDRQRRKLFRRGAKLEKAAAGLIRKRSRVNRSIDEWTLDCASASTGCARRKTKLEEKARGIDRKVVGHNAQVEQWHREVGSLDRRVGAGPPP